MNISKQLKNYRKELNISQEELSEVVHVSRQTISNWENDKSYPDLQSLVLLSDHFKISLDELVKGDVVKMKGELERNEMSKLGKGMLIGFGLMILSMPIAIKLQPYGLIIPLIFWLGAFVCAIKAEKLKKKNNIQTYREIVAYMENGEIPIVKDKGKKLLKENIIKVTVSAAIAGILMYLVLFLFR